MRYSAYCVHHQACNLQAGQAAHASPDAAGAVQKELAGFLKRCPGGVVALDNAQKLHPALLPVFINALSEQGSFEVPPLSRPVGLCRGKRLDGPIQCISLQQERPSSESVSQRLVCELLSTLLEPIQWA